MNKKEQMSCVLRWIDISFLKEKWLNIEKYLKHYNSLDIDGFDLISKINTLREIIGFKNDKLIDILNYIKKIHSFPNAHITYRIILTILVTILVWVVSTEINFSKLKIIKIYLRSIICQRKIKHINLIIY